jgi:hypothetical protein
MGTPRLMEIRASAAPADEDTRDPDEYADPDAPSR